MDSIMNRRRSPQSEWLVRMVLLLALAGASSHAAPAEPSDELRQLALELVNESRKEQGLPPLSLEDELTTAAQAHAEDMLRRGYFAHQSPDGGTLMDRYRAAGGSAGKLVAENIAECRNCAPEPKQIEAFHRGWMESPGHRANILSPGVDRFGFGLAALGGRLAAVQTFAGAGASRGMAQGEPLQVLDAAGQLAAALELVNGAREGAGRAPLRASRALSDALLEAADASGMAQSELNLPPLSALLSSLPQDQRSRFGSAAILAGQCAGCGEKPTAADLRFFVERWLADPEYRSTLLDPRWSELGLVVQTDGEGSKRALAILAGP
jgi:uncharacterized protein YkwD